MHAASRISVIYRMQCGRYKDRECDTPIAANVCGYGDSAIPCRLPARPKSIDSTSIRALTKTAVGAHQYLCEPTAEYNKTSRDLFEQRHRYAQL